MTTRKNRRAGTRLERRAHPRVPFQGIAQINKYNGATGRYIAVVENVSCDGVFIRCNEYLPPGLKLEVVLRLSPALELRFAGTVVRSSAGERDGGTAIAFDASTARVPASESSLELAAELAA